MENQNELSSLIYGTHGLLPPILNVFLYDAPFVTVITGKVGDTQFRWELSKIHCAFQITTHEQRESELQKTLSLYGEELGAESHRIHASLGYFYKACRLIAAGNGPWEFMPETILNLTKSLEVLFDAPMYEKKADAEKGAAIGSDLDLKW